LIDLHLSLELELWKLTIN